MRPLAETEPSERPAPALERNEKPRRSLGWRLVWFLVIWFLSLDAIALVAAMLHTLLRAIS
ncbi:MAG TPA: hypothetical protein VFV47_05765 [Hyphomicrobiaceae bacterium]|nr:hypothetical protein [Hyphomicrobiaceae bacterium]